MKHCLHGEKAAYFFIKAVHQFKYTNTIPLTPRAHILFSKIDNIQSMTQKGKLHNDIGRGISMNFSL